MYIPLLGFVHHTCILAFVFLRSKLKALLECWVKRGWKKEMSKAPCYSFRFDKVTIPWCYYLLCWFSSTFVKAHTLILALQFLPYSYFCDNGFLFSIFKQQAELNFWRSLKICSLYSYVTKWCQDVSITFKSLTWYI